MDEQDNAQRSPAEEQARIVEQMKKLRREFEAASEAKFMAEIEDVRKESPEQADALLKIHALAHARQLGYEALMNLKVVSEKFEPTDIVRSMRVGSIIAKPMIVEERQKIQEIKSRMHAGELDLQGAKELAESIIQADMQKAVQSACEILELRPIPDAPTIRNLEDGTAGSVDALPLPPAWSDKQKNWFALALIFMSAFMADKHAPEMPEETLLPTGTVNRPERKT